MTELDDALNEIIFEAFVEYFSPQAKRKLIVVDSHFMELSKSWSVHHRRWNTHHRSLRKIQGGGIIWRYYKTHKRFLWGGIKIPEIKAEHWAFYINSPGWGCAIKKFHLGDPKLFETIEKWFGEFAAKKPKKRWREIK
jgi:hypothetical protein